MRRTDHAESEAFHRLLHGDSTPEETRLIVRHLVARCGSCLERAAQARAANSAPDAWSYDEVFDRLAGWLDRELHGAPAPFAAPVIAAVM